VRKATALAALLLLAACKVENVPPSITVDGAWSRATAPGQATAAAYATIINSGGADRLISVSSPVGSASIHSTSMDNGVVRMRAVSKLDIPANSTVELTPGENHVMIGQVQQPLEVGTSFPLTFRFERSGDQQVTVAVRDPSATGATM
jgi:periplasmic copper chaperone A